MKLRSQAVPGLCTWCLFVSTVLHVIHRINPQQTEKPTQLLPFNEGYNETNGAIGSVSDDTGDSRKPAATTTTMEGGQDL